MPNLAHFLSLNDAYFNFKADSLNRKSQIKNVPC